MNKRAHQSLFDYVMEGLCLVCKYNLSVIYR